ncbi:hypothetical protein F5148DRAFT_1152503 [Russula earlei]|uniref:Uncharacterized protein n=1 Tax=Russula earlei TaxID=71964 RepID=A0ACC0TW92_9AGAM|nr:hypothetical protein F5148DRAFT_1152503 [Russula earlei]
MKIAHKLCVGEFHRYLKFIDAMEDNIYPTLHTLALHSTMTRFTDALSGILGGFPSQHGKEQCIHGLLCTHRQIYENFVLKSGEGLSIAFVVIWLAGDLCNLLGASMAAAYYTFCDTVLLIQIYYYRWMNTGTLARPEVQGVGDAEEATPLLTSNNNDGQVTEKGRSLKRHVLEYVGMINCLVVAGIVAWAISEKVQGIDEPRPGAIVEWRSQMMGYASALLYGKPDFSHLELDIVGLMGDRKASEKDKTERGMDDQRKTLRRNVTAFRLGCSSLGLWVLDVRAVDMGVVWGDGTSDRQRELVSRAKLTRVPGARTILLL